MLASFKKKEGSDSIFTYCSYKAITLLLLLKNKIANNCPLSFDNGLIFNECTYLKIYSLDSKLLLFRDTENKCIFT